jgi:hypothetical protein
MCCGGILGVVLKEIEVEMSKNEIREINNGK